MLPIHNEITRCRQYGLKGVLGTIISTEGSTYQKAGAKCFLSEDGVLTGLVSGGCVEGDLKEHCKEVLESGLSKRVFYDFRDQGDDLWGLGLGCNGSIEIFLEVIDPINSPVDAFKKEEIFTIALTKSSCIVTMVGSEDASFVGNKWIACDELPLEKSLPFEQIRSGYKKRKEKEMSGLTIVEICGKKTEVFYEFCQPVPKVIVFGAGPDAVPLVNGIKLLNWHVSVVDHRPSFVNEEHFPNADQLIYSPKGSMPTLSLTENTFIIIMSHHFEQDQMILKEVLGSDTAYVGILGPRKRTYQLFEEINRDLEITEKTLVNFYNPIGLDIGAKSPEEISFSILSEMVDVYRGGNGVSLKVMKGPYQIDSKKDREEELAFQT
ncbi:XdhC family protein [Bacillus sp. Marseille-Q3570]|uniref:XdhC family protein n=1 Tax=Bacillus sp. Marseille-Q3570 TaxID=2963522 RepID=UPI0021B82C12|nr:XdhC/CoxI family protein [Bacillus sp. Marseille-Q3570]